MAHMDPRAVESVIEQARTVPMASSLVEEAERWLAQIADLESQRSQVSIYRDILIPQTQDLGSWIFDTGSRDIQGPGSRIQDPWSWILDPGSRIQDAASRVLDP